MVHGTVAAVSDPHEIANVLGLEGVRYMIENGESVPFKFGFGAPSCVPATDLETSGAVIDSQGVEQLLGSDKIRYLSEVMNFPGVLRGDPAVIRKIEAAKRHSKAIDGHAPGLRGEDLRRYAGAGITTDHESSTLEEALEKIAVGMKVQIREGSAAKNFDEIVPILSDHSESCMFCSDDKHPDELLKGHINEMARRALEYGVDPMKVLRVACVNPVLHYGLPVGLLRPGDPADLITVDNLEDLHVIATYIDGKMVADGGETLMPRTPSRAVNRFDAETKSPSDLSVPGRKGLINAIEVVDGQIITKKTVVVPRIEDGHVVSDPARDILKIAVVNRYRNKRPAVGFVKNFGLRRGALASSVAHDSHNVIAVGVSDGDISRAVNLVIRNRGGICAVSDDGEMILPLPIAGLMSSEDYGTVASRYTELDAAAKSLGSKLRAPFMTLSFMSLLVVPRLKLGEGGLFDGEAFKYIDLFER